MDPASLFVEISLFLERNLICKTSSATACNTIGQRVKRWALLEIAAGSIADVHPKEKVTFARMEQWAELICQLHDAPVTHSEHIV